MEGYSLWFCVLISVLLSICLSVCLSVFLIKLPVGARGRSLVPGLEDDFIMEYTITNFVLGPPSDFLVFADTVCFTAEQQETITFVLGTDYNNRHVLREPLRRQLASTMNVTIDRFHMDVRACG